MAIQRGKPQDDIPNFNTDATHTGELFQFNALVGQGSSRSLVEVVGIVVLALVIFGGLEVFLRVARVPVYVFPPPSLVIQSLITQFNTLYAGPLLITLQEMVTGYLIGSTIGLVLAAVITRFPFVEKLVTPYILILVTTPMLALMPLLMLEFGFGSAPRILAVALASGPMVMINAATGFRRTDLAKIALAKSYGASELQIFAKIRFPLALPMIIVGYMVGSIFGLLTAIGAEMVGGGSGLGNRLVYFSSLVQMPQFFAALTLVACIGVGLYVIFFLIGKKWASWEA